MSQVYLFCNDFTCSSLDSEEPPLKRAKWTSVLRLSTMWEFIDIRARAIQELSKFGMSTMDKIFLARECNVGDWLLSGYQEIIRRPAKACIDSEDAEQLGWETAFRLLKVREKFLMNVTKEKLSHSCRAQVRTLVGHCDTCRQKVSSAYDIKPIRDELRQHDFTESIRDEFAVELMEIEDISLESGAR